MEIKYKLYPYPVLAYYSDDYKDGSFSFCLRAQNAQSTKTALTTLFGEAEKILETDGQILFITKEIRESDFEEALNKLKQHGEVVFSSFRVLK